MDLHSGSYGFITEAIRDPVPNTNQKNTNVMKVFFNAAELKKIVKTLEKYPLSTIMGPNEGHRMNEYSPPIMFHELPEKVQKKYIKHDIIEAFDHYVDIYLKDFKTSTSLDKIEGYITHGLQSYDNNDPIRLKYKNNELTEKEVNILLWKGLTHVYTLIDMIEKVVDHFITVFIRKNPRIPALRMPNNGMDIYRLTEEDRGRINFVELIYQIQKLLGQTAQLIKSGMIHCDIRDSNVMIKMDGINPRLTIIDFDFLQPIDNYPDQSSIVIHRFYNKLPECLLDLPVQFDTLKSASEGQVEEYKEFFYESYRIPLIKYLNIADKASFDTYFNTCQVENKTYIASAEYETIVHTRNCIDNFGLAWPLLKVLCIFFPDVDIHQPDNILSKMIRLMLRMGQFTIFDKNMNPRPTPIQAYDEAIEIYKPKLSTQYPQESKKNEGGRRTRRRKSHRTRRQKTRSKN